MAIRVPVVIDAEGGDIARVIEQDVAQGSRGAQRVGEQIGTDIGRGVSQTLVASLGGIDQEFASTGRDSGQAFGRGVSQTVAGIDQEFAAEGRDAGQAFGRGVSETVTTAIDGLDTQFAAEGRDSGQAFGRGVSQTLSAGLAGIDAEAESTGQRAGQAFGDGFTRDANGRLRNARGQYVGAGADAGKGFSDGFSSAAEAGAKDAAGGFSGKLSGSLKAGLAGVAIAAGAALTAGFVSAIENEKQVDRITSALALTGAEAERAGEAAGNLYAGAWGDSMADVTTAVEAVISSIDGMARASSAELEAVTASVLDIATAFNLDVTEAARNAGILLKTGLAGDATEAADLITRSLQAVPVALRAGITDATEEYSQFFAAVGLTGPEAFKLLTDAAEDGQFGIDKMGDAIKEFTIRATDMSKASVGAFDAIGLDAQEMANQLLAGGDTARGAFDSIIDGLLGIQDPADRANTAIALFGTPLEDIGVRDIPQFLAALRDVDGGLTDVAGSAAAMGNTLNDNVATRLETLKRGAQGLLTEGLGALFTAFDQGSAVADRFAVAFAGTIEAFEPVRLAMTALADEAGARLGPVFADIGAKIQDVLLPALNQFGIAIAPIVEFIITNFGPPIIGVFESIGIVLGGLVEIIAGVFNTIASVITGDWSGAWEGVLQILKGALGVIKGVLNLLLNFMGTSFDEVAEVVSTGWRQIVRFFTDAGPRILRSVRDWWSGVVSTFVNAQVRLITGVSNWVSSIVTRFIAVRDRALSYVRSLWSVAQGLFNLGLRTISNAVRSGLGNVLTFFGNLPGQISRSIGNLGSMLYNSGRDVVQGLIDGIFSMLGRLGSAASTVAQTIRNYLPFSPAKLGPLSGQGSPEHSGEVIAQMIADGLTTNVNLPARAMQRALAPLAPTGAVTQAAAGQRAADGAAAGVPAAAGVSVTQVFTGPTTSGGRLREINWNVRYATQSRQEVIGGVAT